MNTYLKYTRCILAVVLGTIFSLFLKSDFTSELILPLIGGEADFETSDFYNRVDANREEKTLDGDIIVVSIDDIIDRAEFARALKDVADCAPGIIGLDVVFDGAHDAYQDSLLINTISEVAKTSKVVAAVELTDDCADGKLRPAANLLTSTPSDNLRMGAVNFISSRNNGTIRSFVEGFETSGSVYPSFASAVADDYIDAFSIHNNAKPIAEKMLHYSSDAFLTIMPEEIDHYRNSIRNKIVLMGSLDDGADFHPTPVESNYPGVLIHANIIKTLINKNNIIRSMTWLDWPIAVLSALFFAFLYVKYDNSPSQNLILRLSLLGFVVLMICGGCWMYSKNHIYINLSLPILLVALSQFMLDLYYAFEIVILKLYKLMKSKFFKVLATCMVITLASAHTSHAAEQLTIYDVEGTVLQLPSQQKCTKGQELFLSTRLNMVENVQLTIMDNKRHKIYKTDSKCDEITVAEIIRRAESNTKSLSKRMYKTISQNIKNSGKKNYTNTGASHRGDDDININTEYVYLMTVHAIGSDPQPSTSPVKLIPHSINDVLQWWAIRNDSDIPLYFNILCLSDDNAPYFIIECDSEMRSLIVDAEVQLNLNHIVAPNDFSCKYMLVASEVPFDSNDINNFFRDAEQPQPITSTTPPPLFFT